MNKMIHLKLSILGLILLVSCSKDDPAGPTNPIIDVITTEAELVSMITGDVMGSSKVVRTESTLEITVEAKNLIPGHIYNLTCSVYNKAENCVGTCDTEDFSKRNVEVEGVAFLVSGKEASSSSETFTATLRERDVTSYEMAVYATINGDYGGLQDAQNATIDLHIMSKGPAQGGSVRQNQLTNFAGGCSFVLHEIGSPTARIPEEIGECAWIYEAKHSAPK